MEFQTKHTQNQFQSRYGNIYEINHFFKIFEITQHLQQRFLLEFTNPKMKSKFYILNISQLRNIHHKVFVFPQNCCEFLKYKKNLIYVSHDVKTVTMWSFSILNFVTFGPNTGICGQLLVNVLIQTQYGKTQNRKISVVGPFLQIVTNDQSMIKEKKRNKVRCRYWSEITTSPHWRHSCKCNIKLLAVNTRPKLNVRLEFLWFPNIKRTSYAPSV